MKKCTIPVKDYITAVISIDKELILVNENSLHDEYRMYKTADTDKFIYFKSRREAKRVFKELLGGNFDVAPHPIDGNTFNEKDTLYFHAIKRKG